MDILQNNPFKKIPQIVLFDLCGTILDSKKLDHEAINYTLNKFNKLPRNAIRVKKDPKKSMKDNFPNFFGEYFQEAYNTYINHLISNINNIPVFENVYEHFRILDILKIKSAIITNRDKKFVDALIYNENFQNINSYIDFIVSADEIGITKPSCKIIDYTLNCLNLSDINKENIVFIGDALADMDIALSYNCIPILLTESTSDITQKFVVENNSKIYLASSYKEINHCLIKAYNEEHQNNEINFTNCCKMKKTLFK